MGKENTTMVQILNHGYKANLNNNQQKPNIAFGSTLVIDTTKVKKQLSGHFGEEIQLAGTLDAYTKKPASVTKPKKINALFSEEMLAKLSKRLTKLFSQKKDTANVKIVFDHIEKPGNLFNEFISCSMIIGDKTMNFIGMPEVKGVRRSSLVRNALGAFKNLQLPH